MYSPLHSTNSVWLLVNFSAVIEKGLKLIINLCFSNLLWRDATTASGSSSGADMNNLDVSLVESLDAVLGARVKSPN
jgi:hypothetical protein